MCKTADIKTTYKKWARSVLICSYHILASYVRYESTHAWPNGISLLNTLWCCLCV